MAIDASELRETVALMRELGVISWGGVTLGPTPAPAGEPEGDTKPEGVTAEQKAAKKRSLFYAAAK